MKLLIRLVGILVLALIASACGALPVPYPAPAGKATPTATAAIPQDGRTKGNPNAPITFVIFSDFQ